MTETDDLKPRASARDVMVGQVEPNGFPIPSVVRNNAVADLRDVTSRTRELCRSRARAWLASEKGGFNFQGTVEATYTEDVGEFVLVADPELGKVILRILARWGFRLVRVPGARP